MHKLVSIFQEIVCALIGHRWGPAPLDAVGRRAPSLTFRTKLLVCARCRAARRLVRAC